MLPDCLQVGATAPFSESIASTPDHRAGRPARPARPCTSPGSNRSKRECRQQKGGETCRTFCRLHIRFTRHFLPYPTLQRGTPARPRELPHAQSYDATARQGLSPQAPPASRHGKLAIRPKSCGLPCVHRRQPRDTSSFNARSSARTPKSGNAASLCASAQSKFGSFNAATIIFRAVTANSCDGG